MSGQDPAARSGQSGTPPWVVPNAARWGPALEVWEGMPVEHWRDAWRLPALLVFGVVASTNDVARDLAESGAPHGTVVLAEAQTAGRGRAGRAWLAPSGSSLLLSIILRPRSDTSTRTGSGAAVLPLLVGLAVARAVECVIGRAAEIKWPNDVLVGGSKVAGILCESSTGGPAGDYVVVGIGLNVTQRARDFDDELLAAATSLSVAAGEDVARSTAATALIAEVLDAAADAGPTLDPAALAEISRRDALFGHTVTIDDQLAGTACGIAADGALMLRSPTGRRFSLRTGTVRIIHD